MGQGSRAARHHAAVGSPPQAPSALLPQVRPDLGCVRRARYSGRSARRGRRLRRGSGLCRRPPTPAGVYETLYFGQRTLAQLIFSGVFDRYPRPEVHLHRTRDRQLGAEHAADARRLRPVQQDPWQRSCRCSRATRSRNCRSSQRVCPPQLLGQLHAHGRGHPAAPRHRHGQADVGAPTSPTTRAPHRTPPSSCAR